MFPNLHEFNQGRRKIPKLMAPINSVEGGVKVIDAGADEVYCAVQIPEIRDFVLYRGPSSEISTYSELGKIVKYAHDRGVEVPLVINQPYMVEIIEKPIKKHIDRCIAKSIDALIIGDFGILSIIKDMNVDIPLYASTYMISMNCEAVATLEGLGFSRVILERHLTLSEVSKIVKNSNVEVEVLIQGGGCSNINGSCFLYHYKIPNLIDAMKQSLAGTPCVLPYNLYNIINDEEKYENIPVMDALGECGICHLPALIKAGVESLKIEGRTASVWYQEATTKVYRELLDLLEQGQIEPFEKRIGELKKEIPFFRPSPQGFFSHNELFCVKRRCYFNPLTHAPYKTPLSWQTWTKEQFRTWMER